MFQRVSLHPGRRWTIRVGSVWLFFLVVTFILGLVLGLVLGLGLGLVFRFGLFDPRVTDSTSILPNLIMFSFTFTFAICLKKPQCCTFPRGVSFHCTLLFFCASQAPLWWSISAQERPCSSLLETLSVILTTHPFTLFCSSTLTTP